MEQTAIEWLIEKLDNNLDIKHSWRTKQYIEQAQKMEKKQIMDAYFDGGIDQPKTDEDCEQHYLETFKNEKEK